MSTAIPGWPDVDNGAYIVQPAPTPPSTKAEPTSRIADGTNSQKLMLFMRGNAMSGAPIISGTNQFPKPPIIAGMTKKKTMIRPCAVVHTLNAWGSPSTNWRPGSASSERINIEKMPPTTPNTTAKMMYIVPMSLWLVEYNHRRQPGGA